MSLFLIVCIFQKKFVLILLSALVFFAGFGFYFLGINAFRGSTYQNPVLVVGRISDDFSYAKYGNKLTVTLQDVTIDGKKEKNVRLSVNLDYVGQLSPGDILTFVGEVENVPIFTLGNFNSFYYRDRTPYECTIDVDNLEVLGNKLSLDEKTRMKVKEMLYKHMGESSGAVAYATLFGDKTDIDDAVYDNYNAAGIIHILTTSGLHVGFLIALLAFALKKCKVNKFINLALCIAFLGLFAYFCNFTPPVLRAGVMGIVLFFAHLFSRHYDGLNSIGLAGLLILLFSPLSALDVGFLMSFFSVLSFYIMFPWLSKLLKKFLPKLVAEGFAVSICAQLAIFPFVALINGSFNLLSFFVNLLVVTMFSALYPFLFVVVMLSLLMPFMAHVLWLCKIVFGWIESLAAFFAGTKFLYNLDPIDIFFVAGLFISLFMLSRYFMTSKKAKAMCSSVSLLASFLCLGLSFVPIYTQSSISYAFYFTTPVVAITNSQKHTILIDYANEGFADKLLSRIEAKNVDTAIALQDTYLKHTEVEKLGLKHVIRYDAGQGFDEDVLMPESFSVKGFDCAFKYEKDRLIGLEVCFDQTRVFVLKDRMCPDNALTKLVEEDYDFVVLGDQSRYAQNFSPHTIVLTYDKCEFADASFKEFGNFTYLISGKNYTRRCLD